MKTLVSKGRGETLRLGKLVAKNLPIPCLLALRGGLGTGKTQFVKGLARGLGVRENVTSPTFLLRKTYVFKKSGRACRLVHLDLFRLKKPAELQSLGLEEIQSDRDNIVVVEWPKLDVKYAPRFSYHLSFSYGKNLTERTIRIPSRLLKCK